MKKIMRAACAGALLGAWLCTGWAEELPKWLSEALAREVKLPPAKTLTSEDGWLQVRVPGGLAHKIDRVEGSYSLEVKPEGSFTVHCELMPGPRDLAALLAQAAEIGFREIAKLNGDIEARSLKASDAGALGAHPFLAIRWMYRAMSKGEQRVGALQQFAADLGHATVYCANDDLGHHESFRGIAREITESLRIVGEALPQPYYREVSVVSLNGSKVGVASTTMLRDEDGDTKVLTRSALLVQRAPGQLLTQDTADLEWVRPDGSLINASHVKAADGQLSEEMALRLAEEGQWRASGTIAGKEVDVALSGAPSSSLAQAWARRELMARARPLGASTEATVWSALDPTRLLPARATVLAAQGAQAYAVREELGSVTMQAVLDRRTGTMLSARLPMGALTLDFERVLQQGEF